ncbi:plasmid partitioning protein RepB [Loktanella sp. SALINAS62]|uniref:plasmid partitioning protein RepB n=1 Tax=Loktanella sp. SALINAS62 TaxID=2706124 RepID=UPI001B8AD816|nr:plasmid partitioning protein RepB [Loktanella sp. SALINAS62]MBS1303421.1 plasmid partitioning protein RepB [Loktanella sp. SALINAS62]
MARKGILMGGSPARTETQRTPRRAPQGAVGALQSSLTKLQESAVQDIDPALIDDAGLEDRLTLQDADQDALQESLSTYGQQVPVLLRPHSTKQGRFEIVYGRRRLRALKALNMTVKAMVRQLDDHALVLAQGQENTARKDLSFIEKASFAAQMQAADFDRQTIAAALSMDLPMVSRMLKVGTAFDLPFLRVIGAAPSIGRDRWMALAALFEDPAAKSRAITVTGRPDFTGLNSDARFEEVFQRAEMKTLATKSDRPAPQAIAAPDGTVIAQLRKGTKGLTLTIPATGFDDWLATQAEALLNELHDRWTSDRSEGNATSTEARDQT